MTSILFCAHSSYELSLAVSISGFFDGEEGAVFEIICPRDVAINMPQEWRALFSAVHIVELPIVSFVWRIDFIRANKFKKFLDTLTYEPSVVICIAWRSSAMNMLAKKFYGKARFVSFLNGKDPDLALYKKKPLVNTVYRYIFDMIFGFSYLEVFYQEEDMNHAFSKWRVDPVNILIELTDGQENTNSSSYPHSVCLPLPFIRTGSAIENDRKVLLFIGERTPLFEGVGKEAQKKFQDVLYHIREEFVGWKLLFRPRPGYTDMNTLDLSGFEVIDGSTSLEYEIDTIRPDFVVSAKSTASKLAWTLNIPSCIFYEILELPDKYVSLLGDFFMDTPTLPRITNVTDLSPDHIVYPEIISVDVQPQYVDAILGSKVDND